MKIALDGVDCTGKSTIAEKLANMYGCNIIHLTQHGNRTLRSYMQFMKCDDVVHDRTFLSELVYSKYFGKEPFYGAAIETHLLADLKANKINMFVLTGSDEAIMERLKARGDELVTDIDMLKAINEEYVSLARKYRFPVIDTTNKTIDQIVKEIGGRLR